MRIAYLAGVLGLLALSLPAAPAPDKADKPKDLIVGKWMPDKDKDNVTLEFAKDGKLVVKQGDGDKKVEISGTYKFVKDDTMDVELDFMGKKMKETLTVTVAKDELTTVDSKGKKETFKRVK